MSKGKLAVAAFGLAVAALAYVVDQRTAEPATERSAVMTPAAVPPAEGGSAGTARQDLIYGLVTMQDGTTYRGSIRWGGDEEALWNHFFNGFKAENPWQSFAPTDRLPRDRHAITLFGREFTVSDFQLDLGKPFMARFGDIALIEASGRDIHVSLKNGSRFTLDRFEADDLADGLRVWDARHGVVDLDEWRIASIELLAAPGGAAVAGALHGTVRTARGDFAGLLQWNRDAGLMSDELRGQTADGEIGVRFDEVRSYERVSAEESVVVLVSGEELRLTGDSGLNRGIYVDDHRYGRVLVSWEAIERVDLGPASRAPAYDDFAPGSSLSGTVITRSGRTVEGRLIYDLDESQTTETLDAPWMGVDYIIPFELVASIVPGHAGAPSSPHALVTLRSGEELSLQPAGDLGELHAGVLVFTGGGDQAEYLQWIEVERIDFDDPALRAR